MSEMKEGGANRQVHESTVAVEAAASSNQRQPIVRAPADHSSAGRWCYDRLKRSTSKVRILCDLSHLSVAESEAQFQRFVDYVRGDTLLACALLEHKWGEFFSTFRNGSVVQFQVDTRNL